MSSHENLKPLTSAFYFLYIPDTDLIGKKEVGDPPAGWGQRERDTDP